MSSSPQVSRNHPLSRAVLGLLFLGALAGGAWLLWPSGPPPAVLMLAPKLEPGAGISREEAQALAVWIEDHLALVGKTTVVRSRELPAPSEWRPGQDGLVVRLLPRREGDALRIDLERARVQDLRVGGSLTRVPGRPGAPLDAITAACRALLPRAGRDGEGRLIPATAGAFWELLAVRGRVLAQGLGPEEEARLRKVAEEAPACATPWVVLGEGLALKGLGEGPPRSDHLHRAYQALEQAVGLVPFHPRAVFYLVQLKVASMEVRDAIGLSIAGQKALPRSRGALLALDYAARYGGLLDLGARAMERLESRNLLLRPASRVQTTWLYRGELDRFERSLRTDPDLPANAFVVFEQGRLALLRGRREDAATRFRKAAQESDWLGYRRLGGIFAAILEGREAEARTALAAFERSFLDSQFPDGEIALCVAEAYALLGDGPAAMDRAERAFTLGFGCVEWYVTNPLLAPVRRSNRWSALEAHLKERQALVTRAYPRSRWGL